MVTYVFSKSKRKYKKYKVVIFGKDGKKIKTINFGG